MTTAPNEPRLAVFLDYENLAIGAREELKTPFDYRPVADAMAERGRVLSRRAYADWSMFSDDRRMLARAHVELIEIPQRMGMVRKNAADIKLAVDAIELAHERDYITTFVIGTGDSDFTPLVHKLREMDKTVIGLGVEQSTSRMLPPACDEFIFYERLRDLTEPSPPPRKEEDDDDESADDEPAEEVGAVVLGTLSGLLQSSDDAVRSSALKRAILRKDPTFRESDHGYRAFGELLRHLADQGIVEVEGRGDPVVTIAAEGAEEQAAMALLRDVVTKDGSATMSGLKDELRKRMPDFNERRLGYSGFLQFCRGASRRGFVDVEWDDSAGDYRVSPAGG